MADENGGYKISDRLLRLSTPRTYTRADGGDSSASPRGGSTRPNSPTRKMTAEEMEASANRMSSAQRRTKELPPIVKSRRFAKEEEERSVTRLYKDAMEVRAKKYELSVQKARKGERCETKIVEQEAIDELVSRMHDKSAEIAKRKQEVLERKYGKSGGGGSRPATGSDRRLTKDECAAMGNRLSTESAAEQRGGKASLFEKYVLARVPKASAMSQEELIDASTRLHSNAPRN